MKYFVSALILLIAQLAIPQAKTIPEALTYTNFTWMKEPWSGDDKPYQRITAELRELAKKKKDIQKNYDAFARNAEANPKIPVAIYKRTFFLLLISSEKTADFSPKKTSVESELRKIWHSIYAVESPKTRSFARVRFFVEHQLAPRVEFLPIAKRLYESDKSDIQVSYRYAGLLSWSQSLENRKLAVKIATSLYEQDPKSSHYCGLLGKAYMWLWESTKSTDDAKQAVHFYELSAKYSSDPTWKEDAARLIASIKKRARI